MLKKKIKKLWFPLLLVICLTVLSAGYALSGETQQPTEDPAVELSAGTVDPEDENESEEQSEEANTEEASSEESSEDQEETTSEESSEDQEETTGEESSEDPEETTSEESSEDPEETTSEESSEDPEETTSGDSSEDEENSEEQEKMSGIKVDVGEGDDILINVSEDVYADGDRATAIDAEGKGKGSYEIIVNGSVTAEGEHAEAIDTEVMDEAAGVIRINGNVEAEGKESAAIDAEALAGSTVTVHVDGSVKAKGENADGIDLETTDDGKIYVYAAGDVTGTYSGLTASAQDPEGTIHVTVGGTIKGDDQPILVSGDGIEEALKLVVWKIELDEEGNAVLEKTDDEEDPVKTELSEAVEKKIHYIIKYDQPEGGWIDLEGTTWEDGFNVAGEGDTVVMKISVAPGYVLLAVYNGLGETAPVYQDDLGNYYVVVPKGGGVYLTAELAYIGIKEKTKIAFNVGTMKQAEHLLGFVAQEEGFFSEEGLNTKIIMFDDTRDMAEALEKGQIGAAFMDTASAVSLQENDHDLIIFSGARADESLEMEDSICIAAYAPTFKANPLTYMAFERAVIKAFNFYRGYHEKTIQDIMKYTEEMTDITEKAIYSEDSYISPDPDLLGINETEKIKFNDSIYLKVMK